MFTRRKDDLEADLEALEGRKSSDLQPDSIKAQASDLKARLINLKISDWANTDYDECPDIARNLDPVVICEWEDSVSKQISDLLYFAEEKIAIRKGFSQTGFAKRELPKLSGSVLDYPLFKKTGL